MATDALVLAEELREHVDIAQSGLRSRDPKAIMVPQSYRDKAVPVAQVEEFLRLVQGSLRHLIAALREQ